MIPSTLIPWERGINKGVGTTDMTFCCSLIVKISEIFFIPLKTKSIKFLEKKIEF